MVVLYVLILITSLLRVSQSKPTSLLWSCDLLGVLKSNYTADMLVMKRILGALPGRSLPEHGIVPGALCNFLQFHIHFTARGIVPLLPNRAQGYFVGFISDSDIFRSNTSPSREPVTQTYFLQRSVSEIVLGNLLLISCLINSSRESPVNLVSQNEF